MLADADAQERGVLAVDVQEAVVHGRLLLEHVGDLRLRGQRLFDVVWDHALLDQAVQDVPRRLGVGGGAVRVRERHVEPRGHGDEPARRPVAVVVLQPDQRVEHARRVDPELVAVALELGVEQRHVVVQRVVPAEDRVVRLAQRLRHGVA